MIASPGGGSEKLKKGVKAWCEGLSFLHLEITLAFAKLCYPFEEKLFFFCHHNFMEKGHSKLSRNEPENIP